MTDHIYAQEHPESDAVRGGGFTLWFTGLSGSGKTTIAHEVEAKLLDAGVPVEILDGDVVRENLSNFRYEEERTRLGGNVARCS
jgi:adenylylsulfate kinase-like enzyme